MKNKFSFTPEQMNSVVEDTYSKIINECNYLIKETKCPNEQIVALLSVIASNYAPLNDKKTF